MSYTSDEQRTARATTRRASPQSTISRRMLLTGVVGATMTGGLLTAGCDTRAAPPPSAQATVSSLVQDSPFYIAHRGGGGNWPEMTAYAYDQATALPNLKAIEISVCLSADGVLVCSHDPTTTRMTGVDDTIRDEQWSTLAPLEVTSAYTDDPTQPARPLSRFDEVIDAHIDRFVAFVEPKTADSIEPLFAKLASLQQPERIVWKQPINQPNFARAKAAGYGTWGYVLNEQGHTYPPRLARFAASAEIDMLGAPRAETDDFVRKVVDAAIANGKKTIMWDIRSVEDRSRALSLGCSGMMTSNIAGVLNAPL